MKTEYHYTISRTDRICLVTFVVILLGWELIKEFLPSGEKSFTYITPPSVHKGYKGKKEYKYAQRTYPKKNKYSHSRNTERQYSSYQEALEQTPPSSPLPIMTASIDDLTSMGLSRKVAYNIQKFISAGGKITSESVLMKIYGMDSVQLAKADDYIIYATVDQGPTTKDQPVFEKVKSNEQGIFDLNTATAIDLESLDGIGPVLAERIIKFRDGIGGFINPDQLMDCYGLPPETFEKIKPQLVVSGSPQVIFINDVNLDSLTNPYLSKKMVRLIKSYKKQHGSFENETEFRKIYPPDSNWCNKILPYISFETNQNR